MVRRDKMVRLGNVFILILILTALDRIGRSQCLAVQFFHYPIALPAIAHWRVDDGFHFQSQNPDGSYHFGYASGTGTGHDESYREERRDSSGRVSGRYGYVDPSGILRTVEYFADQNGFRSRSSDHLILENAHIQLIGPIPKPVQVVPTLQVPVVQQVPLVQQVQVPVVQPVQPQPPPPQQIRPAVVARRFRNKEIKAT